jgi:hypothetical protein
MKQNNQVKALKMIIDGIKSGEGNEYILSTAISGLYGCDGINYESLIQDLNAATWKGGNK